MKRDKVWLTMSKDFLACEAIYQRFSKNIVAKRSFIYGGTYTFFYSKATMIFMGMQLEIIEWGPVKYKSTLETVDD